MARKQFSLIKRIPVWIVYGQCYTRVSVFTSLLFMKAVLLGYVWEKKEKGGDASLGAKWEEVCCERIVEGKLNISDACFPNSIPLVLPNIKLVS